MEPTIIVAIISSICAIAVALVSAIRAARANRELEQYRYELQTMQEREKITRELLEKRADIIGKACTIIQKLRDELRRIKMSKDRDYQSIEEIIETAKQLQALYVQNHFVVAPLDREILHDAKNIAGMIEFDLIHRREAKSSEVPRVVEQNIEAHLDALNTAKRTLLHEYDKLQELLTQLPKPIREGKYQPILSVKDLRWIAYSEETKKTGNLDERKMTDSQQQSTP